MVTNATTLTDPSPSEAKDRLQEGMESGAVLTIFGHCEVEYDGISESYLAPGDRFALVKPDGTVMVHTDEKRKPVNWQNPGSSRSFSISADDLVVESRSSSSDGVEELFVRFFDVYLVTTMKMVDGVEKDLTGTESDLKDRLLDNPDLIDDGFRPQEDEWETSAGPVDIYGTDTEGRRCLVELKRRQIDPEAVHQLQRYLEAIDAEGEVPEQTRGILIAPDVSDRAKDMIDERGFEFREVDPRRKLSSDTKTLSDF